MRWVVGLLALAIGWSAAEARSETASRNKGKIELALQYDFLPSEAAQISDGSGKKHAGRLQNGAIVEGRNRNAIRFDGTGTIVMGDVPASLNPASRALTVGAFCQPAGPDGVLVAMGDKSNGFSLYLKAGVPHFAVRSDGRLSQAAAREPVVLNQWIHLAGAIDPQGRTLLIVNGWTVAGEPGMLIAKQPAEPLNVGADLGSPVGQYAGPQHWQGLVQDVRLYWSVLERSDRDQWQDWADLPGCGCKKN